MQCARFLPCHQKVAFVFWTGRKDCHRERFRARLAFRDIIDWCPVCLPTRHLLQRRRFVKAFFDNVFSAVVSDEKAICGAEVHAQLSQNMGSERLAPEVLFYSHYPNQHKCFAFVKISSSFFSVLFVKSWPVVSVSIYTSQQLPHSLYDRASPHWPYCD